MIDTASRPASRKSTSHLIKVSTIIWLEELVNRGPKILRFWFLAKLLDISNQLFLIVSSINGCLQLGCIRLYLRQLNISRWTKFTFSSPLSCMHLQKVSYDGWKKNWKGKICERTVSNQLIPVECCLFLYP